jgi:hypothetical protein
MYLISFVFVSGLALTNRADAGLVAWWKLDEGSGTAALDSSGNGNDARFQGAPAWVDNGKFGKALRFNGTSDYLAAPDSDSLDINGDQLSIAAWINGETWGGSRHIVRKIADSGTSAIYLIRAQATAVRADLSTSAGATSVLGTTALPVGEWVHIALVYNGAEARIYVNGKPDTAMNISGAITESNNELRIGRGEPSGYFLGMIDDIRLYNHALTEAELASAMEGSGAKYPFARNPSPADGAVLAQTWGNLTWKPGDFAVTHDVYLGDNFDDVNSGLGETFRGNQAGTSLFVGFAGFPYPAGLVPGTTYYWRIDEVNNANPNSPWRRPVWSFSIQPNTAYNPSPADGAEFVDPNTTFRWTPGFGAKVHTVYLGTSFDDVNAAAGGAPLGGATYTPGPLQSEKVYYWRVDEFDGAVTYKGDIWGFTTPGAAGKPQPANGAVDVEHARVLGWTPAVSAASHQIYFGTDRDAVKNATMASPEYKGNKARGAESYDPGQLAWHSTYYWRIDAVYNAGNTVKGLPWSFTTADFIVVDDIESYNDLPETDPASNRIYLKWIDGFGTTTNGAVVGNLDVPLTERSNVHGGAQAMPLSYDNNLKFSEATLTRLSSDGTAGHDWTREGVGELSLWFRGAATNAPERMYVALNGSAVVYHDNPSATQRGGWTQWVIPLQAFADQGVNLANVTSIMIGFGTRGNTTIAGGTGKMYFDDIRLYRPKTP